jgi:Resolvase, N terminal domain/Helix-turn-helix domain of resolvase
MEPVLARVEAVNLLAHRLRDPAGSRPDHDVDMGREAAEPALRPEATPEGADRVGRGVGFLRALLDRPIGEPHEGTNDLVAPWGPVHKAELPLCKRCGQFHGRPCHPPCSRGADGAHRTTAVMQEGAMLGAARGARPPIRSASMRTGVKDVGTRTAGDTLVVWRLDRLGRSLKDLIEQLTALEKRHIGFKSLTENIDTTTSGGKLIFHIFGALAEFERDLIKERTEAGLQAARERGRKGGRPKVLTEKKLAMAKALYADKRHTIKEICHTLNIGKTSLYRYLKAAGQ